MNDRDDPRKTFGSILDRGLFADHPTPSARSGGVSPFGDRVAQHRSLKGGVQWEFKFNNGYGASVVRHSFSYGNEDGLWELAVLGADGHLTYATPITDDVIGWLSEDDVAEVLDRIEQLPVTS